MWLGWVYNGRRVGGRRLGWVGQGLGGKELVQLRGIGREFDQWGVYGFEFSWVTFNTQGLGGDKVGVKFGEGKQGMSLVRGGQVGNEFSRGYPGLALVGLQSLLYPLMIAILSFILSGTQSLTLLTSLIMRFI